ncbi:17580_t:CDS:2 [Dentiscutata erythropus]|uniref:17580_t:CDS:1 n=1 Tax=Dentiscutata erythropus TaxID=1348616 RepID=A0A9N9FMI5_9GLOM|nr:17580_t:CDS:2 [Dentiscutata erythropus]
MQLTLCQENYVSGNKNNTGNSYDSVSIKNQKDDTALSFNNFDQTEMLDQPNSYQSISTSLEYDATYKVDTTLNFQKNSLKKCLRANCTNLRYVENGRLHDFCGQTCAKMISLCAHPKCFNRCYIENDGRVHRYCGRSCARKCILIKTNEKTTKLSWTPFTSDYLSSSCENLPSHEPRKFYLVEQKSRELTIFIWRYLTYATNASISWDVPKVTHHAGFGIFSLKNGTPGTPVQMTHLIIHKAGQVWWLRFPDEGLGYYWFVGLKTFHSLFDMTMGSPAKSLNLHTE